MSARNFALGLMAMLAVELPQAFAAEESSKVVTAPPRVGIANAVGLPAAQDENCRRSKDRIVREGCARVRSILAIMSAEPRAAWADKTEAFLRDWMERLGPDGFTFRRVECRLSWCVLESESTVGAGSGSGHDMVMPSAEAARNKLFQVENTFAPKPDDPSVSDVLIFFKRYCKSVSEALDSDNKLAPNFYTLGETC